VFGLAMASLSLFGSRISRRWVFPFGRIYYCTYHSVVDLAITMNHDFANNPDATLIRPGIYTWYRSLHSDTALAVLIHLKNSKGDIVSNVPSVILLHVHLVQDNGVSLENALSTKKTVHKKSIFSPCTTNPRFEPGKEATIHYSFRIEELSSFRGESIGFKIAVSSLSSFVG